MAKHQKPPQSFPVSIEYAGKTYTASYYVAGGCVTVSAVMLGSKTTQVGGSQAEQLASIMLRELLDEAKKRDTL